MANYTEIVVELQAEAERLTHARDKAQQQLDRVMDAIKAIEVLAQASDEPIIQPSPLSEGEEQGFTSHVRAILKANPLRPFTAVEIRNQMQDEWSTDHEEYDPKVRLIHIHNTLKRLFKQEEVIEIQAEDGRTAYKWKRVEPPVVDLMAALKESLAKMNSTQSAIRRAENRRAVRKQKEDAERIVKLHDALKGGKEDK